MGSLSAFLFLAGGAEAEEQQLVAGHLEARRGVHFLKTRLQAAGVDFHGPPAGFALEVVMVVPGAAADEAHDLIGTRDGFGPPHLDEALEVSVDGGDPGSVLFQPMVDIFHGEGAFRGFQHLEDGPALGRNPHPRGAEGGDGGIGGMVGGQGGNSRSSLQSDGILRPHQETRS